MKINLDNYISAFLATEQNLDYDKFLICAHEAAHLICFQYFNYGVDSALINYDLLATPKWSGICIPKKKVTIKDSHAGVISYAGFFIENYLEEVDAEAIRYKGDKESWEEVGIPINQLSDSVNFILNDCAEALIYITLMLYIQDRVSMRAHTHYDEEFANWDF